MPNSDTAIWGRTPGGQALPANSDAAGNLTLRPVAGPSGGATHIRLRNVGAVAAIKASGGTLYGVTVVNNSGAAAFIQLFDQTAATPGTTLPDLEFLVNNSTTVTLPLPLVGVAFSVGISVASTTSEGGATPSANGVQLYAQYA